MTGFLALVTVELMMFQSPANAHDLAQRVATLGEFRPPAPATPDNRPDAIVEAAVEAGVSKR